MQADLIHFLPRPLTVGAQGFPVHASANTPATASATRDRSADLDSAVLGLHMKPEKCLQ